MNWIAIGTIDEIPLRGARCVKTPQGKIGVFRTAENAGYRTRRLRHLPTAQLGDLAGDRQGARRR